MQDGQIQIYCGEGHGKSAAAQKNNCKSQTDKRSRTDKRSIPAQACAINYTTQEENFVIS